MADRWLKTMNDTLESEKKKQEKEDEEFEFQEEEVWDCIMNKGNENSIYHHKKSNSFSISSAPPTTTTNAWHLCFSTSPKKKITRAKSCGNEITNYCVQQLSAPIKIIDTNPKASVEDDDGDDEMIPPHIFIAQKIARVRATIVVAYSMFEGIGRTLKGRDLCKLRNAILIKTGFIEQNI